MALLVKRKKQKDRAVRGLSELCFMSECKKKIAIYGGSFSPPHIGHILAARAYLDASGADKIVIIPAKHPPHKQLDRGADDADRINMCRLAFCEDTVLCGRCEISDYEICSDSVSYTINTVEHFQSLGYDGISLLIGTDMLLTFESWCRYRDIFERVTLYYINRYDSQKNEARQCAQRFRDEYGARIYELDVPVFEASSSSVRSMIAEGKCTDGMLCEKVIEYIDKNGLYKSERNGYNNK